MIAVFMTLVLLLFGCAGVSNPDEPAPDPMPTDPPPVVQPAPEPTPAPAPAPAEAFKDITAAELIAGVRAGWNLGNTLDTAGNSAAGYSWLGGGRYETTSVMEMETAWGNPYTTKENIEALKNAGFNALRIPVTWYKALDAENNIREDFMARVKEIVDYAVEYDLYIFLNTHHDEAYIKLMDDTVEESKPVLARVWEQIADEFKDYSEKLVFEGMNEPRTRGSRNEWSGGTAEEHRNLNALNQVFVDTVRKTGGFNDKRILLIPTYAASASDAAQKALTIPNDTVKDKIIVSIHAYAPWEFALRTGSGSVDTWSKDKPADTNPITHMLDLAHDLFVSKGVPVLMGEMGAMNRNNVEARVEWAEFYFGYARSKGIPCIWWDNGVVSGDGELFGILDRRTNQFVFPEIVDAIMRATG